MKNLTVFLFMLISIIGYSAENAQAACCNGCTNCPNPVSKLTSPSNNASYTAPANVVLTAVSSSGTWTITKVEFYNGSTLLFQTTKCSMQNSTCSYTWNNPPPGHYSLTSKAYVSLGDFGVSAPVNISVNAPNPSVSLISPSNGASFVTPSSIVLTASASASYGSISKVEFYNGATLLETVNRSPYTYIWSNVPQGTYSLTAKAYSNFGSIETSAVANVAVYTTPNFIAFDNQCRNKL